MQSRNAQTRLESFLHRSGVKPAEVAREARISRQHLLRLRKGETSPTVSMIVKLTRAFSRILDRTVAASELFRGVA